MQARDGRDEAETEPGAGLDAARLEPHETLQHPLAIGAGDARTTIGDDDLGAVPATRTATMNGASRHVAAGRYLIALSIRLAIAWPMSWRLARIGDAAGDPSTVER